MDHITVCVCTFRRPEMLRALLAALAAQRTEGRFGVSVTVVDNDAGESARATVESFSSSSALVVRYFVEREQSIAGARNQVVRQSQGDFLAFIDDDELPGHDWLLRMHSALVEFQCDGVLAPVLPRYDFEPPAWVVRGNFHDRPAMPTGAQLPWTLTRTGNALLRRSLFRPSEEPFRREFASGGEDRDFFRRMIERGHVFRWLADAPVYETVPRERCTRSFMIRRALLRGKTPYNQRILPMLKSLLAVPLYALVLPFALVRHDWFMKLAVKWFDHVGRIFHFVGLRVVRERYVVR